MAPEVEDSGANSPADVENSGYPDKLLREQTRKPNVAHGEDHSDNENEHEKNDRACVEREGVGAIVDAASVNVTSVRITVKGEPRDGDEAAENGQELEHH